MAKSLSGIGEALVALGRPGEALEPLERATRIQDARDVQPWDRAHTAFALARALEASGEDPVRARALAEAGA